MIHIVVGEVNRIYCIHAIKAHLPLMMGEIVARMADGVPMYSFEPYDANATLVKKLIADLKDVNANLVFKQEMLGEEEIISEKEVYAALRRGAEIATEVDREMEREATRVVAVVHHASLKHFQDLRWEWQPDQNVFDLEWDTELLRFLDLTRGVPQAVQFFLLGLEETFDGSQEPVEISEIERLMGLDG